MSGGKTLISVVDDDPGVRRALARLLKAHGFMVRVFSSADEFLQQPAELVDCLILDLQMPGVDGLALQRELGHRGIDLPIVFITAHADVPKSVEAMKNGAIDFLQKPFEVEDLLKAIGAALSRDSEDPALGSQRAAIRARLERLTPREVQVFERVAAGANNKEIAADLGLSIKTVKVHRARVMRKMEADSIAELARMAERIDR